MLPTRRICSLQLSLPFAPRGRSEPQRMQGPGVAAVLHEPQRPAAGTSAQPQPRPGSA